MAWNAKKKLSRIFMMSAKKFSGCRNTYSYMKSLIEQQKFKRASLALEVFSPDICSFKLGHYVCLAASLGDINDIQQFGQNTHKEAYDFILLCKSHDLSSEICRSVICSALHSAIKLRMPDFVEALLSFPSASDMSAHDLLEVSLFCIAGR